MNQPLLFSIEHARVRITGVFVELMELGDPTVVDSHEHKSKLVKVRDNKSFALYIDFQVIQ
jgi:hypothetical protein